MSQSPPQPSLQKRAVLCGGGFSHHVDAVMPLSVKSFQGGDVTYTTARGRYLVDEKSWLIINDQEPYRIDFDSPTPIRSTVVFFPSGWADVGARVFREPEERLLDEPAHPGERVDFLETVMPDDEEVRPRLRELDAACRGQVVAENWLEERLRELLAAMVLSQRAHRRLADRIPAARAATREELYRRVRRGRDFLGASALTAPTLAQAAGAACLSPYHFQRTFRAVFEETPHDFVSARRLDHARGLLERGAMPVAEVSAAVGYESYSAFHAAYQRRFGCAPGVHSRT